MAELWADDVARWWLPNDEGYSDTIRTVREFVEHRGTRPTDAYATGIRDMSGIFRTLDIADQGFSEDVQGTNLEGSLSSPTHDSSPEYTVNN